MTPKSTRNYRLRKNAEKFLADRPPKIRQNPKSRPMFLFPPSSYSFLGFYFAVRPLSFFKAKRHLQTLQRRNSHLSQKTTRKKTTEKTQKETTPNKNPKPKSSPAFLAFWQNRPILPCLLAAHPTSPAASLLRTPSYLTAFTASNAMNLQKSPLGRSSNERKKRKNRRK